LSIFLFLIFIILKRFCSLARKSVFENRSVLKYVRIAKNVLTQSRGQKGYQAAVFLLSNEKRTENNPALCF